ncbi:MAG: SDR family oxidoreductase [Anaerolineae bacterium]|nr:SDR family oxidoreductase [Anaerolineae bacterium]
MILVVGATGRLGGDIALRLLSQGKPVRVLLRRNSPAEAMASQGMAVSPKDLLAAGAEPVYGDMKDRASLDPAMRGVETVITTANSALRGGDDNPMTVELQGNKNLIDAAKAAGVEHFIFVSILGYDPDSPNPFFAGKSKTEEYLINSGMHYTILAPGIFAEVWFGMVLGMPLMNNAPVTLVAPASHRHTFVSSRDVAAYAVAAVDHPSARDKRIPIGARSITRRRGTSAFPSAGRRRCRGRMSSRRRAGSWAGRWRSIWSSPASRSRSCRQESTRSCSPRSSTKASSRWSG